MSANDILIDTNIAIYYLSPNSYQDLKLWLRPLIVDGCIVSIFSKIELLGWQPQNSSEMLLLDRFVSHATILRLSDEIAERTIEVRRQYRLKLPDAVIAATALTHNLTLVTHNTRDFTRVEGLRLHDLLA